MALFAAPGLLAGTQIAGLIFFLNPDLPFDPQSLARGAAVYGGLLGAASAVLLTLLTRPLGERALRALPWVLTAILAGAALLHWVYASRYSFYLPPGINVRMIKAATWLSVLTLALFYTALLHSQGRRPYGWRSRLGVALLAAASVYVIAERREAFKPQPAPTPLPSTVALEQRPSLMVVGLDGATLDAILPLARQGHLPFFARLINEGVYARAVSFGPVRDAALWTTLATGKLPYKHGVLGDRVYPTPRLLGRSSLRLLPDHLGFGWWGTLGDPRPTGSRGRQSLALWEILDRLGMPVGVVGWPATFPVPRSAAFAFSDRFFADESLRPGSARPDELAERGRLFRVEVADIDRKITRPLGERPPLAALDALAQDLWRESLTQFMLEQRPETRAVFLMLPGLETVSALGYGGYSAVQFAGVRRGDATMAAQLVTAYYSRLDAVLAALWQQRPEPKILAVVSAHGFEAPEGLGRVASWLVGRPHEGRAIDAPDGVLFLAGTGLRAGTFVSHAELIDVMPTLLYALGFPIARDLDGRVLTAAFDGAFLVRQPLAFVPSYDTLAAELRELQLPRPLEE